jgi:hypothetical protein
MEEDLEFKRAHLSDGKPILPVWTTQLWCGKVQGLCDGNACLTCHLFPRDASLFSVENDSTIDKPTLTDHNKIGMTREEE